jgi:2-hydroxychromene-2-carboxylate isomerase
VKLQFWYDFSSPFAYLASTQVEAIAERTGAELTWEPMLLGAVFKQVGTPDVPLAAMPEPKRRYMAKELHYWASLWGVPFRFTSRFPMRTVTALRLVLLAGDAIAPLSHALYRALWVDDRDISDPSVLAALCGGVGLDGHTLLERAQLPDAKQLLIDNTSRAIDAGVFGAPTFIVHQSAGPLLFWGQDRLPMVERALTGWRPSAE